MADSGEKAGLVLKPKYVFSMILGRTVFFYFFGSAFLSIISIGLSALAGGGNTEAFPAVASGINTLWLVLYISGIGPFMAGRYKMGSYRFYSDRVEYDAVKFFTMESRAVTYNRIVETGRTKGMMQAGRGMGNIVLKVSAAGVVADSQGSTVLLDNLILADIENVDENLEKVRRIISKK